ncbi:MAG TPA: lipoyl(octanoyl) transferase LipB [Balneolaceae bacterium]|nr:lipoyl(octanoyl) transferase LipB [Balneolaceae bacterium]
MKIIELYDLGRAPYQPVWELQTAIQQRLIDEKLRRRKQELTETKRQNSDVLLFVEHPHVYTLGKSGDKANMLKGLAELAGIDAEFVEVDRGGDITYHGPGQIVGYPIFDMGYHFTDVHKYLRYLEEIIIRTCADYGIKAGRIKGLTGVWVDDAKICAMGIRCSRWVTMHGFALNVNADLSYFNHIIPCGITDKKVTSLGKILGRKVDENEVKQRLITHFENVFNIRISKADSLPELDSEFSYLKKSGTEAVSH